MTGAASAARRITIHRATVAPNDFNEPVQYWNTLATVWANRSDVSASEAYRAQEVGAEIQTRFTIRHSSAVASVNPTDRVIHGDRVYEVTGVREKQRNRWIEIDCVARADLVADPEQWSLDFGSEKNSLYIGQVV